MSKQQNVHVSKLVSPFSAFVCKLKVGIYIMLIPIVLLYFEIKNENSLSLTSCTCYKINKSYYNNICIPALD